ncbi:beta-glucan synthesis-associated [Melanogaster broomeanus]|nr:beta-glucan synthesis-associated [Melanogaster broomeanus]
MAGDSQHSSSAESDTIAPERHEYDFYHQDPLSSPTPRNSSTVESPLLQDSHSRTPSRSLSSTTHPNFVSSPLNPNVSPPAVPFPFLRSRPQSRQSMHFNRVPSEESQTLAAQMHSSRPAHRGSMILYRLANEDELLPPKLNALPNRDSVLSTSADSVFSLSYDSKYPSGPSTQRGLIPYTKISSSITMRGLCNVGVLVLVILSLLSLFIVYPVLSSIRDPQNIETASGNTIVNGSALTAFAMPALVDPDTPESAKTRTGYDNAAYTLVFSDEFNKPNRSFWPGDDPFWEAVDLWYWSTADEEWYDPGQVTTKDGYLSIVMDNVAKNGMPYRSGMLQSWNKFCFTTGYIEVSVSLPGPNQETMGYWPGAWTMGNLARPGYGGTTDGVWPYSYDACDTLPDGSGPASAVHSDASKSKYNFELSWLPGQRLSACTCPGEDHPGPSTSVGRGAPEIDILEVEHNKLGAGQVVSQSGQFAPFTHDYIYLNDTQDEWVVYTPNITAANSYRQQAVSALTLLPDDIFQESGAQFTTFGFEYWSDPQNPSDGYITWQSAGVPSARVGATALGPDQGTNGTGVSQRLISLEPMSIVLNLGLSPNWQTIDLTTMIFPAEMRVDYVRVYQREGQTNVGCSPPDFPTEDYINRHMDSYMNPNLTAWNYPTPKNSLVRLVFFSVSAAD